MGKNQRVTGLSICTMMVIMTMMVPSLLLSAWQRILGGWKRALYLWQWMGASFHLHSLAHWETP